MAEPTKRERAESEAVTKKHAVLIAQVSWCAHVWNASPSEAAQRVVSDLFDLLARGGTVPVRVEASDGAVCELEITARR